MAKHVVQKFPTNLFSWSCSIAMSHMMAGFMVAELSVIWDIDPWIYNQNGINGIGEHDRHDYNVFAAQTTYLWGAFFGLIASYFVHYGRRKVIITGDIFIILSCWVLMVRTYPFLILGRALRGVAYGTFIFWVPLFISEISPRSYKAQFVSLLEIFQWIGVMACLLMGFFIPNFNIPETESEEPYWHSVRNKTINWRIFFLFPVIPALIQMNLLLFVFKEDSPRYCKSRFFNEQYSRGLYRFWHIIYR